MNRINSLANGPNMGLRPISIEDNYFIMSGLPLATGCPPATVLSRPSTPATTSTQSFLFHLSLLQPPPLDPKANNLIELRHLVHGLTLRPYYVFPARAKAPVPKIRLQELAVDDDDDDDDPRCLSWNMNADDVDGTTVGTRRAVRWRTKSVHKGDHFIEPKKARLLNSVRRRDVDAVKRQLKVNQGNSR